MAFKFLKNKKKESSSDSKVKASPKKGGLFAHSSYWESEMKMPTLGHFRTYNFDGDIRRVDKNRDIYNGFRKAMEKEGWDFLPWDPFQHKPRFYRKK